jgi:hypothetical protein
MGKPKRKGHLEDLGLDGRILKWLLNKHNGGVIFINLIQGRDRRSAFVDTVMNLRVI